MTSVVAAVVPTDEQQRIIDHDHGPALVFAVAGAGKTTTMVRRVERLVRERIFRPERILAASFSKATVEDLKRALSAFPHASKVQVKTLHALGYAILRDAQKLKLGADLKLPEDVEAAPHLILNAALSLARSSRAPFLAELDSLDREDFFAFVGGLKATLAFTKERLRELPRGTVATEVESPASLPWYGDLYRLFEKARLEQGILTFDDLVPEAWARLIAYPALAERHRGLYDAVLVDEFQDTNLSQVELLDLLVREHNNVMAVGDDDQTIFGFRKASNTFILGFARRYGATTYRISDNFRCFAEHTILANHVILRNKVRAPKQLAPARGFGGETVIAAHESADEMGAQIARSIQVAIDSGLRADQVAVLVRLYAETGPVETALLEAGVPYRIVGNVPFYDRPENTLLLKYLEVALIERRTTGAMSASDKAQLSDIWWDVLRTPKRYVRRDAGDALLRDVLVRDAPPSVALLTAGSMSGYAGPKLVALGQTLSWLVEAVDKGTSAYALLLELEARLEYKTFLLENSGFAETGQGKAQNVAAFIEYAKSKGDAVTLLAKIDRARALHKGERGAQVVISSIFRAKGLEWPHVIVPAVNYGHIPAAGNDTDLSEERRLFYVALTRTKRTLELHVLKNRPPSIFMEGLSNLRAAAEASREAFSKPLGQWGAAEAVAVVDVYRYLDRYVDVWSGMDQADQKQLAAWMLAANKAYGMKSTPPLPRDLELRLSGLVSPDEAKVEACARQLGVQHRLGTQQALPASTSQQRRLYSFEKDGRLVPGARVWHKMHGPGRVVFAGKDQNNEVVEVAFDKGRKATFLNERASLEIPI